jgi:putative chitinase
MNPLHLSVICSDPDTWLEPLDDALIMFQINTASRRDMFLAQVAHESAGFTEVAENLNYSAAALLRTFPSHFTAQEAADYARQPERIANRAYADRNGNGDEASGDGWRYRGRGLIQLTGRNNYARCGSAIGIDLVTAPEMLESPEWAAKSAGWFWWINGCNELADSGDFDGTTKRINGGLNGQDDRLAWLNKIRRATA